MPDPTKGHSPSGGGQGQLSPAERAAFDKRVADLDEKLDKAAAPRHGRQSSSGGSRRTGRGMAYGLRMATELVASVLVGGLIGYGLDAWLGTKPWLFLLFFLVGFAAGIVNLLRAYRRLQAEIAAQTGGDLGKSDLGRSIVDDDE